MDSTSDQKESGWLLPGEAACLDQDDSHRPMPIAIVGMGFRGPGDATNVEKLWDMIREGREAWSKIPASKWNHSAFYHPDYARHGTTNVQGGHFLAEDVSLFDAPFFNMTSDEAAAMDPQQRLLLEVTYEGFENAGIPLHKVMGSQTACFVGCFNADYTDLLLRDPERIPIYQCTNAGQSRAMTANRISYFFDMKGPSVTVDTACSGSLVALHLACHSLQTGDASMAVAAGVNVILSHEFMSTLSMMKFLSPDGRCHAFDEKANGYARGEGIGCVILKPLRDALRDNDPIRAIIRGSGANQDGRTPGITLPSGAAQEALIRSVYQRAGLDPSETAFVETHGTGTQAGDPIETGALGKVFADNRDPTEPLRIGSVKTNIGHLEGSSGIAAVIKAALMLENRTFLPNRNFERLNGRILLNEWNLQVQLCPEPWESSGPRRVSVNSFGYGGSNAHVIMEEALSSRPRRKYVNDHRHRIYMLSGFDEVSIANQINNLREYLARKPCIDDEYLKDLAFTLNERRTQHRYRTAVIGESAEALVAALKSHPKLQTASRRPNIGFVFTGQGAQWCGMGKELLDTYPVFRQSIDRIDRHLQSLGAPFSTVDELQTGADPSVLNHPLLSQSICTAIQIALIDLLASWGIHPSSVTGHSSGEVAAAYAFGALSMEDAMTVAYSRGVVARQLASDDTPRPGTMLAVGMSADEAQQHVNQLTTGRAVIACINSPSSVTVSGDTAAIDELQDSLHGRVFTRRLAVKVAYHSHHMESVAEEYMKLIAHIKHGHNNVVINGNPQGHVSFFSSVTGAEAEASDLGPKYWVRNLVSQVRFTDALRALCFGTSTKQGVGASEGKRARRSGTARKARINMLVEIGPHAALSGPIKQIIEDDTRLKAAEMAYSSVLIRESHAVTTALNTAAALACAGHPVNFQAINNPPPSRPVRVLVDLPPYAWNHTRSYWAEPRLSVVFRKRKFPRTDLLGAPDTTSCPFEPRWRNVVRLSELPWLQDHRIQSSIVYPAAAYIAMAIEAVLQLAAEPTNPKQAGSVVLEDVSIKSALIIPENSAVETVTSFRPWDSNSPTEPRYEFHIYSATDDNTWTEHCSGFVGFRHADEMDDPIATISSELSVLNVNQFYGRLSSIGLEYGPCFSNLSSARFADYICMAKVSVPDTASVMPMGFEYPCVIHPCTLDSIIQTVFVGMDVISGPAVPVHIDEISVSRSITSAAGSELDVRTHLHRRRKDGFTVSISATERDGSAGIAIKSIRCKRLDVHRPAGIIKAQNRIAYDLVWRIDPDFLLLDGLSKLFKRKNTKARHRKSDGLVDTCASHYMGRFVDKINQLHGKVDPHRASVLKRFQRVLKDHPRVDMSEEDLTVARCSGPQGALLCMMGEGLLSSVKGEIDGPDNIDSAAWEDYWKIVHEDPITDDVMEYLDLVCHKNPMISILELEAGAGGAFQRFLKRHPGGGGLPCSRYVVTHRSSSFVQRWTPEYAKLGQVLGFKQLDIEKDSDVQELCKQRFDVIIGLNGLYTVKSKHIALRNIHTLLKEDGKLLLIDPVPKSTPTNAVIFSNSPGQWSKDRFGHLESDWRAALVQAQFFSNKIHVNRSGDRLMLVAQNKPETAPESADILIIVDDHCAVCLVHLQELFLSSSSTVEVTDLKHADPAGKLTIVLSDLTQTVLVQQDETTWDITKNIFLKSRSVLWITRGGAPFPINPETGLITGFARTARSESGVQPIVTLDLDGRKPLCEQTAARLIYDLVRHRFLRKSTSVDTEYSEKNGLLLIPRVVENTDLNNTLGFRDSQVSHAPFHQPGRPLRAVVEYHDAPRVLFEDIPQTTPLADGDVRIEVHAVSVSKHSLDMVNDSTKSEPLLVDACSGIVVTTGTGMRGLSPGDRVLCLASGTLASVYQDKETAFYKIPLRTSMEAAASLPMVYCAAFHVVHNIAHVRPGQKVLICSAATPFTEAAIELCRRSKAHVFATVSTAADRRLLLSTSLVQSEECILQENNFTSRDVLTFTKGGVDVVIDFDPSRDRHLTDLVRPYGHLIQVDNRTFQGGGRRQVAHLRDDISFITFDFDHFRRTRPEMMEDIFTRFGNFLQDESLHVPSLPTYPTSKAADALQKLESDPGSDPIIITATSKDIVQVMQEGNSLLLRPDASYMLVGGLGGIGRVIALWMADHGAKTLILVSRRGILDTNAKATVEMLERKGVEAIIPACDVSSSDQMSRIISELSRSRPPIRGVLQAAMVLKDTHIEKMSLEEYESVLRPKYNGTWNLHRFIPSGLDWFIMLSSISGIIGNATQAAYAAGSTFMDTFAAYRQSLGLPAVSLDLGVITDSGYLSENPDLASKMARQGFQGTDTMTLMSLIEVAITHQVNGTVKPQIITGLGEWKESQSLANFDLPLFSHFRRKFLDENIAFQAGSSLASIRSELQAAKSFDEATNIVYTALSKKVAANMSISVDGISPSKPISEYGVDSHFAVELRNWISKNMDSTVPILEILASGSLIDLAGKIVAKSDVVHVE